MTPVTFYVSTTGAFARSSGYVYYLTQKKDTQKISHFHGKYHDGFVHFLNKARPALKLKQLKSRKLKKSQILKDSWNTLTAIISLGIGGKTFLGFSYHP